MQEDHKFKVILVPIGSQVLKTNKQTNKHHYKKSHNFGELNDFCRYLKLVWYNIHRER